MSTLLQKLRRRLLGVSPARATFFSRGDSALWKHLENAALTELEGYHLTLEDSRFAALTPRLDAIPLEMRSYAYEGAAMALTGLEVLLPWKKRLHTYLAGPGEPHLYMAYIGVGEALALLHRNPEPYMARLEDTVNCWLVIEGYGFHKGLFHRGRSIAHLRIPGHISTYGRRIFDQGLGRSIWFLAGANVERIAATLATFPVARQGDLWVGTGVACAYVGGIDRARVEAVHRAAGPFVPQLAMGVAFAAKGRQRAGNLVPHTDLVCDLIWGLTAHQTAELTTRAFQHLPADGPEPAFEVFQRRMLTSFADRSTSVS